MPGIIRAQEKQKLWERIQKYYMICIPVRDLDGTLLWSNRRYDVLVANGKGDITIYVRAEVHKLSESEVEEVMFIENNHAGELYLEMLKNEFEALVILENYWLSLA